MFTFVPSKRHCLSFWPPHFHDFFLSRFDFLNKKKLGKLAGQKIHVKSLTVVAGELVTFVVNELVVVAVLGDIVLVSNVTLDDSFVLVDPGGSVVIGVIGDVAGTVVKLFRVALLSCKIKMCRHT